MSVDGKTFLKLAWVDGVPHRCLDHMYKQPIAVTRDMLFGMVVLSFPAGILYLLAVGCILFLLSPFELPVSLYVLLWFGFFVAGYLQWFHLLPQLLRKHNGINGQSVTTLGLDKIEAAVTAKKRRRPSRAHLRAVIR